jgi:hypothetical protein
MLKAFHRSASTWGAKRFDQGPKHRLLMPSLYGCSGFEQRLAALSLKLRWRLLGECGPPLKF